MSDEQAPEPVAEPKPEAAAAAEATEAPAEEKAEEPTEPAAETEATKAAPAPEETSAGETKEETTTEATEAPAPEETPAEEKEEEEEEPAAEENKEEPEPAADGPAAETEAQAADASEPEVKKDAQIIFVLGGPGSGKGTQCEQIVEKYGFSHFSAGDLLRAEVASGSDLGKDLQEIMKEGKLVPSSTTIQLLKKAIANAEGDKFLVDGFPRALDQAEEFEKEVIPCKLVLFFDCPMDVMQERLLKRAETSGRADDNLETIKKRFDTFVTASMPVIDHFEKVEKVAKISAVPSPDDVFVEVRKVMEAHGFVSVDHAEEEAAVLKLQSAFRKKSAAAAPAAAPAEAGATADAPAETEAQAADPAETAQVLKIESEGESVQAYLEKSGVVDHLKFSLKKLDISRTGSPFTFLSQYFAMVAQEKEEPALE